VNITLEATMGIRIEAGVIGGYDDYECDEELYCPECGKQGTVWVGGEYSYEKGANHLCIACGLHFTLPTFDYASPYWQERAQIIREVVAESLPPHHLNDPDPQQ
jgi:hypothetical protein